MTFRCWPLLMILGSMTAGCPDKESGDTGTGPPPACKCIDPEAHGVSSYTCSHDGGCDDVVAFCDVNIGMDTPGCSYGVFSVDEVALDCAIDQLISGQPGLVWWQIDTNGPERYGAWVDIGEARQGVGRSWDFIDLGGTDYDAGTMELKDAAYFEECKTKPDVDAKFLCFRAWSKTPPDAVCDVEEYFSDPF